MLLSSAAWTHVLLSGLVLEDVRFVFLTLPRQVYRILVSNLSMTRSE